MADKEFLNLVKDMRQAQKDYFRNRTSTLLKIARELERQVDAYLKDYESRKQPTQASLEW